MKEREEKGRKGAEGEIKKEERKGGRRERKGEERGKEGGEMGKEGLERYQGAPKQG